MRARSALGVMAYLDTPSKIAIPTDEKQTAYCLPGLKSMQKLGARCDESVMENLVNVLGAADQIQLVRPDQ